MSLKRLRDRPPFLLLCLLEDSISGFAVVGETTRRCFPHDAAFDFCEMDSRCLHSPPSALTSSFILLSMLFAVLRSHITRLTSLLSETTLVLCS